MAARKEGGARGDLNETLLSARVGTGAEIFDEPAGALEREPDRLQGVARRRGGGRGESANSLTKTQTHAAIGYPPRRVRSRAHSSARLHLPSTRNVRRRRLVRVFQDRGRPPRRARALPRGRPRRRPVERPRHHRLRVQDSARRGEGPPRQRIRAGGHPRPRGVRGDGVQVQLEEHRGASRTRVRRGGAKRTATPRGPRPPRARSGQEKKPTRPGQSPDSPPFSRPSATWPGRRETGFYCFRAKTRVKRFSSTTP